jgi:hypothetical protein
LVEVVVQNAHAPDEIIDISNVFLMRLGSKDNGWTPGAIATTDPTVIEQNLDVSHNDFAFVRSIVRLLLATDRGRATSVNGEPKVEKREFYTSWIKTVPVQFNDEDNGRVDGRVNVWATNEVLGKSGKVAVAIPEMDVSASIGKWNERVTDSFAVAFKKEYTVINVVAVIHWDVLVKWFWAP